MIEIFVYAFIHLFILLLWQLHIFTRTWQRIAEPVTYLPTRLHHPLYPGKIKKKKKEEGRGVANLFCHRQNRHPIVQCLGAAAWSSCLMGWACLPGKTIFDSPAPRDREGDLEFTVRRRTVGGNPSRGRAMAAFRCVTAAGPPHQNAAVGRYGVLMAALIKTEP